MIYLTISLLNNVVSTREIYQQMPFNKIYLSDILPSIKTGDIILYRSSLSTFMSSALIPTLVYKHIGIVLKIDNVLYITESSDGSYIYNKTPKRFYFHKPGADIVPLDVKLKHFCGMVFLTQLNKPLPKDKENAIIDKAHEYSKISKYPSPIDLYSNFVFNLKLNKKSLYCFEYIYLLLQHIGIINNKKRSALQICNFMANISIQNLEDGYEYNEVDQLIIDY